MRKRILKNKYFICFFFIGLILFMGCNNNNEDSSKNNENFITPNQVYVIEKSEIPKFEKEALLGSSEAAFKLYQFYEMWEQNYKKGLYWLTISAENNHPIAQYNLAYKLMEDENYNNRLRARFWAKKSHQNGEKLALDLLKEIENKEK